MSEMGLERKGSFAHDGEVPNSTGSIDAGMPSGGSPGDGTLAAGPTAGGGVIGAKSAGPIK